MEYRKLAHITEDVSTGETTKAAVLALITAEEMKVVNLKGLILTAAQVDAHLDGTTDGETAVRA
jgi:hypothetical protein